MYTRTRTVGRIFAKKGLLRIETYTMKSLAYRTPDILSIPRELSPVTTAMVSVLLNVKFKDIEHVPYTAP